jgi:hypothetical protein
MAVYEALLLNTAVPQIQAAQAGDSYVMVVNATTPALRITQTGTGNAISVEDEANPDATPFVVTAAGDVGIGTNAPAQKLSLVGTSTFNTFASGPQITMTDTSGRTLALVAPGSVVDAYVGTTTNHTLNFMTGGTGKAVIDVAGNLGLGVTPSAWTSAAKAVQVGARGSLSYATGGTVLGQNYWSDGAAKYIQTAQASALSLETDGSFKFFTAPSGTAGDPISFTQAMTLDASGNLALGNTSVITGARADIRGANSNNLSDLDAQVLTVFDTTSYAQNVGGGIAFGYKFNSSNSYIQRAAVIKAVKENSTDGNYASALVFATTANGASTTERARIDSSGNLLVGTTASTIATITQNSLVARVSNGSLLVHHENGNTGSDFAAFGYSGSTIGTISQNSTTTVGYNTSSDYRLKNTIAPMTGALAKVALLKPVTYKWNADGSDGQGFIAHELAEIVPECVNGEKDAVDEDGNPKYQGIDTSFLVATLTAAIKEQQALIESLTARVAQLEQGV